MRRFFSYLVVLLCVCVAMVLFFNSSSCLAYSFDDLIEFSSIVVNLPEANSTQKSTAQFVLNNQNTIRNKFGSNLDSKDTWLIYYNQKNSSNRYRILGVEGGTFNGWTNVSSTTNNGIVDYTSRFLVYYNGSSFYTQDYANSQFQYGLFNKEMAENIDFTGRVANNYYSNFDMSFTHGYSEDLNYNGEVVQAVKLNYNNTRVFIETVTGYDEATQINAKLGSFDLDFVDYDGTGIIAKYQLLSRLSYNQPYNLVVNCLYDGEPQEISETIVFVPEDTIIENGSITYYPSGDSFNTQNATNTILNYLNSSGDVDGQFDNIFSGDTQTIAGNLSYPNIPYTNYWMPIYNFAVGICDTLQASGDVYYDIPIRGTAQVKRVYASSFSTPDSPLFQFISATLVFGVVFELYVQFKDFIYFLNTANFHEAIKQLDSEENQLWRM